MSDIILRVDKLSKQYRLGNVGTGTLSHDLNRTWYKMRGKEDPYLKIGSVNDRSASASSDYVWALQHINFEVERGEILGIIGKNGAGKSTLLKILSRVTSPTTGSIKVGGRMASLLEVGTGMHPELTGRENIYLNGAIMGMTKAEIKSKIDDIVEFSGCQMYIDTPVKRYSSGMGVRLGFAVAAFLEPEILVVDEVLAVGDAEFQKKAIGKMQDISNTGGRTVLFVSHNMAVVESLCSRVIVLENGKIINGNGDTAIVGVEKYLMTGSSGETVKRFRADFKVQVTQKKIYAFSEPFVIDLNIDSQIESNVKAFMDIAVVNQMEEFVLHYKMDFDKDPLNIRKGKNTIQLTIENPRLVVGEYSLIIYIYDKLKEVFYWVEEAANFKISNLDGDLITTTVVRSHMIPQVIISHNKSINGLASGRTDIEFK
jgi:lipopolysaccharide transport system ATP-binding protein